jgi:hypothetical protein
MSVTISSNPGDELNCLYVKVGHPLRTIKEKSDDDVAYLEVPYEMLEELKRYIERAIKQNRAIQTLYTADFKLRHNFDISLITKKSAGA